MHARSLGPLGSLLVLALASCLSSEVVSAKEIDFHEEARIEHQKFARELDAALEGARVSYVYRLAPSLLLGPKRRTGPRFLHNYLILGRARVRNTVQSTQVREQLVRAVRATSGASVYCFEPRHGVRVVRPDGSVIDSSSALNARRCGSSASWKIAFFSSATSNEPLRSSKPPGSPPLMVG